MINSIIDATIVIFSLEKWLYYRFFFYVLNKNKILNRLFLYLHLTLINCNDILVLTNQKVEIRHDKTSRKEVSDNEKQ